MILLGKILRSSWTAGHDRAAVHVLKEKKHQRFLTYIFNIHQRILTNMASPAGLAQGDRRATHHGPRTTARAPRRATGRADHGHRITYNRLRRRQQLTDPELTAHGSRNRYRAQSCRAHGPRGAGQSRGRAVRAEENRRALEGGAGSAGRLAVDTGGPAGRPRGPAGGHKKRAPQGALEGGQ